MDLTNLAAHEWRLIPDGIERPVLLGNLYRPDCAQFSMLYRFYAFSTTTGADYIYYYRSTLNSRKTFYLNSTFEQLERPDTCGVLEMYLNNAYKRMG